jgi:cytochrome c peroxidase
VLCAAALVVPLGLDLHIPAPEANPITVEKVERGRRLFNDRRLSRDRTIACSSCHDPDRAFTDGRRIAVGVDGRLGRRNAPAIINRGYGRAFFWDGRVRTLEEQVAKPIQDVDEMDFSVAGAASRVGMTPAELTHALSTYVRSILSGNAPFDRFVNGESAALSTLERQGLQIFRGGGNCTACHVGPNFTDEHLHNTGVAWQPSGSDEPAHATPSSVRAGYFRDSGDGRGAFKTPTLREVARTAPYMHDGSVATLREVIDYYDRGGNKNPFLDSELHSLGLTSADKLALLAFLGSLSGTITQ